MNKRVYDAAWGTFVRSITTMHRAVHQRTGGRLWSRLPRGGRIAWLTTLGRRSGQWRTTPLLSVRVGEDWVVTGSNGGQAKVPGWVYNARDHAGCEFEVDGQRWSGAITEVTGPDRDALYAHLTTAWPLFPMYERKAERYVPVFRVSRSAS
jgi:deazaflavin-dependent oxidoreductase (nitroreductase family)